jgi:hypothetical protein
MIAVTSTEATRVAPEHSARLESRLADLCRLLAERGVPLADVFVQYEPLKPLERGIYRSRGVDKPGERLAHVQIVKTLHGPTIVSHLWDGKAWVAWVPPWVQS